MFFLTFPKHLTKFGMMDSILNKNHTVFYKLLQLLKNYFQNREQRVVLNGQTSGWRKINSGVPQGPVLGPLLFDLYK